jgi:hypothetical protein
VILYWLFKAGGLNEEAIPEWCCSNKLAYQKPLWRGHHGSYDNQLNSGKERRLDSELLAI